MSVTFGDAVAVSMRNTLPWVDELEHDKFLELRDFIAEAMDRSFNSGMDYARDEALLRDEWIASDYDDDE